MTRRTLKRNPTATQRHNREGHREGPNREGPFKGGSNGYGHPKEQ
jgi:hypothetical protein